MIAQLSFGLVDGRLRSCRSPAKSSSNMPGPYCTGKAKLMKNLFAILLLSGACFLFCPKSVQAANYYADPNTGKDGNAGTTPALAWKNAPGMTAYTGSGVLKPGDTVYFNSGGTWLVTGAYGLSITGGVAY